MKRLTLFALALATLACATGAGYTRASSDTVNPMSDDGMMPSPGEAPSRLVIQRGVALPEGVEPDQQAAPSPEKPAAPNPEQSQAAPRQGSPIVIDTDSLPPAEVVDQLPPGAIVPLDDGTMPPPAMEEYAYVGGHPIPDEFGGGWCTIDGPHKHPYPPDEPELYTLDDDAYDFGVGPDWVYYEGHPIPTLWGGGWCDLIGRHSHQYRPWLTYRYDRSIGGFRYVPGAVASPGEHVVRFPGVAASGPAVARASVGGSGVISVPVQPLGSGHAACLGAGCTGVHAQALNPSIARAVPGAGPRSLAFPRSMMTPGRSGTLSIARSPMYSVPRYTMRSAPRSFATRSYGARSYGARSYGARYYGARYYGARYYGARYYGARYYGARSYRTRSVSSGFHGGFRGGGRGGGRRR